MVRPSFDRYSLGLQRRDGLDRTLGGLPKGRIVLLEDETGSGGRALCGRFAHGLTDEGTQVTYVCTRRRVERFLRAMRGLGYDVSDALSTRRLRYLFGNVSRLVRERDAPPRLVARLTASRTPWTADVAVVATLGDLLRYDPDFGRRATRGDAERATERLVAFLRRTVTDGQTVVLGVDPMGLDEPVLDRIRTGADLHLRITRGEGARSYQLDSRRAIGVGDPIRDTVPFSVRPGRGVVIETQRVVRPV